MAAASSQAPEGEEVEVFAAATSSGEDGRFDAAVGVLEEALVAPEFKAKHDAWCRTNCKRVEPPADLGDGELSEGEFSLEAHAAFQEYVALLEGHLERSLADAIESAKTSDDESTPLSMEELVTALAARAEAGHEPMDSEVFDLMYSLGDFGEFASLMLSWRE